MQPQTTKTFQHATRREVGHRRTKPLELEPDPPHRLLATTFVVVFELTAGSVWNLLTIEWVEVQLDTWDTRTSSPTLSGRGRPVRPS
jgi:hypothetical protein